MDCISRRTNATYPMTPIFGELDGEWAFPADASDNPSLIPLPAIDLSLNEKLAFPSIVRINQKWGGTIRITSPTATPSSPPRDTSNAGK